MQFVVVDNATTFVARAATVILRKDEWDDFGFLTQFTVFHARPKTKPKLIGKTKILQRSTTSTAPPSEFRELGEEFCSLGQSPDFYERMNREFGKEAGAILDSLRDVHHAPQWAAGFQDSPGFKRSLIRFPKAERLFGQTAVASTVDTRFTFKCQLNEFSKPHVLNFQFDAGQVLTRLVAIVGNNGVGKTGVLARLAYALSGEAVDAGAFEPRKPSFSRVLAITYGVMHPFKHRASSSAYRYCGSQDVNLRDPKEALNHFLMTSRQARQTNLRLWDKNLSQFMRLIGRDDSEARTEARIANAFVASSAGFRLYAQILADLCANLVPGTLLLFDEPELHLHPSLINTLMVQLGQCLRETDSFGIVATHSPFLMQDMLASQVRIMAREGGVPSIETPTQETFGATLSDLAAIAFRMGASEYNYMTRLQDLAAEMNESKLRSLFKPPISIGLELGIGRVFDATRR